MHAYKQMQVVRHTAYAVKYRFFIFNKTPDILVKLFFTKLIYRRDAVLGTDDDVI